MLGVEGGHVTPVTSHDQSSGDVTIDHSVTSSHCGHVTYATDDHYFSRQYFEMQSSPNHKPPISSSSPQLLQPITTNGNHGNSGNTVTNGNEFVVVVCVGCGGKVTDRYYLLAVDSAWHIGCLRCYDCHVTLNSDVTCFAKDGAIYCRDDYIRRYSNKRCGRCQAVIGPSELVMRARDHVFHVECFACVQCGHQLTTGEQFSMHGQLVFCRAHADLPNLRNLASRSPMTSSDQSGVPSLDYTAMMTSQLYPDPCSLPNPATSLPTPKSRSRKRRSRAEAALRGMALKEGDVMMTQDGTVFSGPVQRQKRMRTSFKHHQLRIMKSYFGLNHNPDSKDLKQLSQKTGLSKRVLQVWFQNARAKYRRSVVLKSDDGQGDGQKVGEVTSEVMPDSPSCDLMSDLVPSGYGGEDSSCSSAVDLSTGPTYPALPSPTPASDLSSPTSLCDLRGAHRSNPDLGGLGAVNMSNMGAGDKAAPLIIAGRMLTSSIGML